MHLYDERMLNDIAVNGCSDKFNCHKMWMEAYYTNDDPKVIMDYCINTVEAVHSRCEMTQ